MKKLQITIPETPGVGREKTKHDHLTLDELMHLPPTVFQKAITDEDIHLPNCLSRNNEPLPVGWEGDVEEVCQYKEHGDDDWKDTWHLSQQEVDMLKSGLVKTRLIYRAIEAEPVDVVVKTNMDNVPLSPVKEYYDELSKRIMPKSVNGEKSVEQMAKEYAIDQWVPVKSVHPNWELQQERNSQIDISKRDFIAGYTAAQQQITELQSDLSTVYELSNATAKENIELQEKISELTQGMSIANELYDMLVAKLNNISTLLDNNDDDTQCIFAIQSYIDDFKKQQTTKTP